jgi:hypothetical protein
MENTSSENIPLPREIYYYRQRFKNAVFSKLQDFFSNEAENSGITKGKIAAVLRRDPAQITRWLSSPGNLTLETLSDLLFAMGAEPQPPVIVKIAEQRAANYMHPLAARILARDQREVPPIAPVISKVKTSGGEIGRPSVQTWELQS